MPYTDAIARVIIDAETEARARVVELQRLHDEVVLAVIASGGAWTRMKAANDALGKWMAAASDDPTVCTEMKADIDEWFRAQDYITLCKKVRGLLCAARIEIGRAEIDLRQFQIRKATAKRKPKGKRHGKRKT